MEKVLAEIKKFDLPEDWKPNQVIDYIVYKLGKNGQTSR